MDSLKFRDSDFLSNDDEEKEEGINFLSNDDEVKEEGINFSSHDDEVKEEGINFSSNDDEVKEEEINSSSHDDRDKKPDRVQKRTVRSDDLKLRGRIFRTNHSSFRTGTVRRVFRIRWSRAESPFRTKYVGYYL